jgi:hypothetical protein
MTTTDACTPVARSIRPIPSTSRPHTAPNNNLGHPCPLHTCGPPRGQGRSAKEAGSAARRAWHPDSSPDEKRQLHDSAVGTSQCRPSGPVSRILFTVGVTRRAAIIHLDRRLPAGSSALPVAP